MEKWNELCFILSDSIPLNSSEQLFEQKVIQAFEKLGWSEYKKEIAVRENIQLGAAGRIHPDIIIKSEAKNLFVVEVKKPSTNLDNPNFKEQLSSYMRMLRLNFGILIGNKIKIFVDGSLLGLEKSELLEEIEFTKDNPKGLNFINLFQKENFSNEKIENYIQNQIENIKKNNQIEILKEQVINTKKYSEHLRNKLKKELRKKYGEETAQKVLENLAIKIFDTSILSEKKEDSKKNTAKFDLENELEKVHKRVRVWFNKPHQSNSQILIKFLELKEQKTPVTRTELEDACREVTSYESTYHAMKTLKNNQAKVKVFEENGQIITLWNPVKEFIKREFKKFKKNASQQERTP